MSTVEKKNRICNGLPHCIAIHPDGFERLKAKLGLNRDSCKSLIESAKKQVAAFPTRKPSSRLSSSDRDRRLLFDLYQDKNRRYDHWAAVFSRVQSGDEKGLGRMLPSLEHRLLVPYLTDYDHSTPGSTRCAEVFAEWPDLVKHLEDHVLWGDFAAYVWADIRARLNVAGWEPLNSDERETVAMVAFAIATIVDDERLLRAAAKEVPDMAKEFADLLGRQEILAAVDVLHQWNHLCGTLQLLSEKGAGSPPDVDVLAEIKEVVGKLSAIEQPVRERCAPILYDKVICRLNAFLEELKNDADFSWLGETERAHLHTKWQSIRESASMDQIHREMNRLNDEVPVAIKRIRNLAAKLTDIESECSLLCIEAPTDLASRHSLEERRDDLDGQARRLRGERRQAETRMISELSPFGETFDMGQDPSDLPPSQASHPEAQDSAEAQSDVQPPPPGQSDDTPITSPAPSTEVEPHEPGEAKADEPFDASVTSTDDDELLTYEPIRQDANAEPNDPRQLTQLVDPIEASRRPDKPTHHDSREADPLAARAVERIADALLEPSPRISYALHIGRLLTRLGIGAHHPPAPLLDAALLSDHLSLPDGAVATELTKVLDRFPPPNSFADSDDSTRDCHMMLALAGTLRPALIAPQSGAWGLLSALKPSDRLTSVYRFVSQVAEKSQRLQGVRIDPLILKTVSSEAAWNAEREQLRLDASEWETHAQHMTFKYAPATNVWKSWLSPNGLIASLMGLMASDADNDALLQKRIAVLDTRKEFNDAVRKTDREQIRRQRGQDIHARALDQLYDHARKPVEFVRRHLSLNSSRPSQSNFVIAELTSLRATIDRVAEPALTELRELASEQKSLFTGAANTAAYAINRFRGFLDDASRSEPDPIEPVASGLFQFSVIPIRDDGSVAGDPRQALDTLLSTDPETLISSFDRRLAAGDFSTARRIIDWLDCQEMNHSDDIIDRFDDAFRSETGKLRHEIDDARTTVEVALARGHLNDAERDNLNSKLVEIERRVSGHEMIEFDKERSRLREVGTRIESALDLQRSRTKAQLEDLTISSESVDYKHISDSLAQGDITTANELIEQIRRPDALSVDAPPSEQRRVFQEFYPTRSDEIEKAIEDSRSPTMVVSRIANGEELGGMEFGTVPGAQRRSAEQMLKAWFNLERPGRLDSSANKEVTTLFSELGFIVRKVDIGRGDRNVGEALIQTAPLRARERCPVPTFGSLTDGNYRIVFLWGRPTEEDILQHAEEGTRRWATIVIYFGRLTNARRKMLAILSRQRSQTLLVLDELLLVFLCGERASRIPTLFACTVPFTYVQPYVTTAGLVPPEMFYGREQEIRDLQDPNGPCFIYGGRQLGKTVLLRAVEAASHRPKEHSYALWIDLKGRGIGYDRTVAEIWLVLWRELRKVLPDIPTNVKEPNPNLSRRVDDFVDFLSTHFHRSTGRVLLLLLDEADRFLELDARELDSRVAATGYRESSRLKALMDRTERSIKVVFAGLHNVLRTVEYSNHPLAHFGDPIGVGPLWSSAEALVRQPLFASGYRFANDNLVTRILAQTNYYPNLIQLYGSELVRSMCSRRMSGAPLYDIDDGVLDATYMRTNLREMIRSRFHMTLQLDPRYDVIAYSIAYECHGYDEILSRGLDYRRIEEISKESWPEGFRDIGTDHFRSLLDEMKGLGVLREVDHRYTLRNPNVLLLMGTDDEILVNLERDRELPQEFEPELFRAHDPQKSDGPSRSPLTYQQECLVRAKNRVSIVCGLKASGYEDVLQFLRAREASDSVIDLKQSTDHREFQAELRRHHEGRPEGTTIYTVSGPVPWSEKWVQEAFDSIRNLRRKDKSVHVLFMADSGHLLQLLSAREDLDRMGIQWVPLHPWREGFLRQWMDDVGFMNSPEVRKKIVKRTGGWPVLLYRLYDMVQEIGNLDSAIESLDDELGDARKVEDLQREFGLDGLEVQKRTLRSLAQLGEANYPDLKSFAEDDEIDGDTLRRTLNWAELLHLARQVDTKTWQMDSVVARLFAPQPLT